MLRTRVGYCGGSKANPTYYGLGDHTEAISIDFDPKVISYENLLGYFWRAHRCGSLNTSRQYRNAVFYRNESQKRLAESSRAQEAKRLKLAIEDVTTEIVPVGEFTYAEGYHQKYYLTRHRDVRKFLTEIYPSSKELADSTVATRLNAYLGAGMHLDWSALLKELPSYGLPDPIRHKLEKTAKAHVGARFQVEQGS